MSTIAAGLTSTNALVSTGDTSGQLVFQTNGTTTAMTIDTSQNVGIGTNSPTSRLDVNGAILSRGDGSEGGQLTLNNPNNAAEGMIVDVSAADTGRIFSIRNNFALQIGQFAGTGGNVAIYTAGAERMRIDSSGDVGIGVTPSVNSLTSSYRSLEVGAVPGAGLFCGGYEAYLNCNVYYNGGWKYANSTVATQYAQTAGSHSWSIAPSGTIGNAITFTQAMTLDSIGNLLVGASSGFGTSARLNVFGNSGQGFTAAFDKNTATAAAIALSRPDDGTVAIFYRAWAGGGVGSISVTSSATAYNTSSDYRLKENIQPMQNALDVVAQLNPVTYTWKVDGSDGQGFIAHELQEIVPDCVTGEKDAVDEEGKPVYQGIDTSFLVATLTKAIQEQQAIINELKSRIETLENK